MFLLGRFPLSALWIYHSVLSWPARFLLRIQQIALLGFTCMRDFFSPAALKILSLCLIVVRFIKMSLWEDHFGLKFWGCQLASWTWISYFLPRFKKVPVIISLNKLFTPFSLAVSMHSSDFRILHWCTPSNASWWHARAQTYYPWACAQWWGSAVRI